MQVSDPRTARVSLERVERSGVQGAPGAPRRKGGLPDEEVFRAALEWLRAGVLPESRSAFRAAPDLDVRSASAPGYAIGGSS